MCYLYVLICLCLKNALMYQVQKYFSWRVRTFHNTPHSKLVTDSLTSPRVARLLWRIDSQVWLPAVFFALVQAL